MRGKYEEDEAISNLLGYFAERVNLVFSFFYCTLEFETDKDFAAKPSETGRAWALQTIRTACLHSTLIALRDLDDVLTPRTAKSIKDDLKVSDFGYPSGHSFLGTSERERINKMIAHATLPGSELPAPRWAIWALATKGIHQSLNFLKWAEDNLDWSTALFCGTRIQKTHDYFAELIEHDETVLLTDFEWPLVRAQIEPKRTRLFARLFWCSTRPV